ncbi:hypothetical protein [Streptomyces sp. H27-H5]|uniref:hypothetical protein n=1 Tax=Streptomyces sp. H27-H5 TaxID=2996460 RepID=UPI002271E355|nr:hypothetical protein [Streptomyces sp. H27-H5]MCY0958789.1 hypothetical protein [Streptomyces sp. H27-H5]
MHAELDALEPLVDAPGHLLDVGGVQAQQVRPQQIAEPAAFAPHRRPGRPALHTVVRHETQQVEPVVGLGKAGDPGGTERRRQRYRDVVQLDA